MRPYRWWELADVESYLPPSSSSLTRSSDMEVEFGEMILHKCVLIKHWLRAQIAYGYQLIGSATFRVIHNFGIQQKMKKEKDKYEPENKKGYGLPHIPTWSDIVMGHILMGDAKQAEVKSVFADRAYGQFMKFYKDLEQTSIALPTPIEIPLCAGNETYHKSNFDTCNKFQKFAFQIGDDAYQNQSEHKSTIGTLALLEIQQYILESNGAGKWDPRIHFHNPIADTELFHEDLERFFHECLQAAARATRAFKCVADLLAVATLQIKPTTYQEAMKTFVQSKKEQQPTRKEEPKQLTRAERRDKENKDKKDMSYKERRHVQKMKRRLAVKFSETDLNAFIPPTTPFQFVEIPPPKKEEDATLLNLTNLFEKTTSPEKQLPILEGMKSMVTNLVNIAKYINEPEKKEHTATIMIEIYQKFVPPPTLFNDVLLSFGCTLAKEIFKYVYKIKVYSE